MYRLRITGDLGFEVWQDIPGWEGLYQSSTYGRVRSIERTVIQRDGSERTFPSKVLSTAVKKWDVVLVTLVKRPIHKSYNVHRIIAETFIPNPQNYPQVNHKDENRLNNRVENLEWCTAAYNCNYGSRNEKIWKTRWGK